MSESSISWYNIHGKISYKMRALFWHFHHMKFLASCDFCFATFSMNCNCIYAPQILYIWQSVKLPLYSIMNLSLVWWRNLPILEFENCYVWTENLHKPDTVVLCIQYILPYQLVTRQNHKKKFLISQFR